MQKFWGVDIGEASNIVHRQPTYLARLGQQFTNLCRLRARPGFKFALYLLLVDKFRSLVRNQEKLLFYQSFSTDAFSVRAVRVVRAVVLDLAVDDFHCLRGRAMRHVFAVDHDCWAALALLEAEARAHIKTAIQIVL